MHEPALVTVLYGPYESCGLVEHRTYRLLGLQETCDWNRVELLVRGRIVFSCDIRRLQFGGDGKLDPLCTEAVLAVDGAHK